MAYDKENGKKRRQQALDKLKTKMKDSWEDPEKRKDLMDSAQKSLSAFTKNRGGGTGNYSVISYQYKSPKRVR
jgi:hypothetical protein